MHVGIWARPRSHWASGHTAPLALLMERLGRSWAPSLFNLGLLCLPLRALPAAPGPWLGVCPSVEGAWWLGPTPPNPSHFSHRLLDPEAPRSLMVHLVSQMGKLRAREVIHLGPGRSRSTLRDALCSSVSPSVKWVS